MSRYTPRPAPRRRPARPSTGAVLEGLLVAIVVQLALYALGIIVLVGAVLLALNLFGVL